MAGSIEKRGDSYRLVCVVGYNLQGRPIKKSKTVHCSKKEAKIELAKFVADVQKGMYIEGKSLKFTDFVEIWKRDYGSKELAPSTYKRYLGILESRIIPFFGHFRVDKIKPTDIMQFYDLLSKDTQIVRRKDNNGKKTGKPLSPKTILEHHRLLRAMLQKAVYWQMIVSNPAERVQAPKTKKPKRKYYDDEQSKALISGLMKLTEEQFKYKVAIILTIFTGVRLGELMGLEWDDINFREGIVSINRSSQYLADKGVFTKVPKTESSIRNIPIPDFLFEILQQYVQSHKIDPEAYILTGKKISFREPRSIEYYFKKTLKKCQIEPLHFHCLRHTFATRCVELGFDMKTLSEILGHSNINTTLNRYVHPSMEQKQQNMDKLNAVFTVK